MKYKWRCNVDSTVLVFDTIAVKFPLKSQQMFSDLTVSIFYTVQSHWQTCFNVLSSICDFFYLKPSSLLNKGTIMDVLPDLIIFQNGNY